MNLRKSILAWLLLLTLVIVPGCTGSGTGDAPASNPGGETSDQPLSPGEEKTKEDFTASTAEHDTDVGLKNIKIDTAELSLTEEQKAVLDFFDDDYLDVPSYGFLRRYPKVFEGAQLTVRGSVKKVISMDADSYELALWVDVVRDEWKSADLENLKLEYYDHDLNKIWDREFPQTTSALYDYTKNNIYLVANNELYIINIETGEDTFEPSYVGEKAALRKLHDGILMISAHKSDGVMKCALDGSIIWKTNLENDVYFAEGLQMVGSNIVFQYYWSDDNGGNGTRYVVLDNESGDITVDAVPIG